MFLGILLNGFPAMVCSLGYVGWVNVKDVANAHIQAYEIPTAV